jgi:hypothetical protein
VTLTPYPTVRAWNSLYTLSRGQPVHAILIVDLPAGPSLRGYLKKLLLVCPILVLVFQARTSQVGMIVLDVANLAAGRLPSGWQLKVNHGTPQVSACGAPESGCLHLKSVKASFALERSIDVDPMEMPYLNWDWKVSQIPATGDFRRSTTDDQAAQVLVAFSDRRVLSYIWDSTAPKGTLESASSIPFVRIFALVCQSGSSELNQWIPETHHIAADYQRAYGKPAPRVKGLRLQINSQHTNSVAESYFGEIAFRATPIR